MKSIKHSGNILEYTLKKNTVARLGDKLYCYYCGIPLKVGERVVRKYGRKNRYYHKIHALKVNVIV